MTTKDVNYRMWETIRTPLIIVGVVVFIAILVFLYLFIAGADESRRRDRLNKNRED